ncbi:MAG TPA: hypothetical protein VH834_20105 [Solirubrobacteraceae bacterium]|jgi:hypothetical protein
MRYLLIGVLAVFAAAGCGSGASDAPMATTSTTAAHRAPVLVTGQRNGGALSATLDAVLVRSDGWTRVDKRHGGAGRRYDDFRLSTADLRRLRAALDRLPERQPRSSAATGRGASYLLRYRGVTYYAVAGAVPRGLRPAIDALQAIIDGGGRSGHVIEVTQAPA